MILSRSATIYTLVLTTAVAVSSYFSIKEDRRQKPSKQIVMTSEAEHVVLRQMNDAGTLKIYGTAEHAKQFSDGHIKMRSARIELHQGKEDLPPWKLSSNTAMFANGYEKIELDGNVVVTRESTGTAPPIEFNTPHLTLFPNRDYAESAEEVKVFIPNTGTHMLSKGMRAYLRPEKLELLSDVRSTYDQKHH